MDVIPIEVKVPWTTIYFWNTRTHLHNHVVTRRWSPNQRSRLLSASASSVDDRSTVCIRCRLVSEDTLNNHNSNYNVYFLQISHLRPRVVYCRLFQCLNDTSDVMSLVFDDNQYQWRHYTWDFPVTPENLTQSVRVSFTLYIDNVRYRQIIDYFGVTNTCIHNIRSLSRTGFFCLIPLSLCTRGLPSLFHVKRTRGIGM